MQFVEFCDCRHLFVCSSETVEWNLRKRFYWSSYAARFDKVVESKCINSCYNNVMVDSLFWIFTHFIEWVAKLVDFAIVEGSVRGNLLSSFEEVVVRPDELGYHFGWVMGWFWIEIVCIARLMSILQGDKNRQQKSSHTINIRTKFTKQFKQIFFFF